MHPVRRVLGLLTGVLVLQLTLLGAAAPCTDAASGAGAAPGDMRHTTSAGHEQHAAVAGSDASRDGCGEHPPEPGSPPRTGGTSCVAMISCVTPLLQIAVQPSLAGPVAPTDLVALSILEPPTRSTAPELPPPRA